MNEYAASYSRVEKIVNAVQSMKECLICKICLELFQEPVTIKCGHKFCRSCILRVANNENAACPFCNIKIQKRSIPKESNKFLQSCIDRFNALSQAIFDDSGIDVSQPYNKTKNTKESISVNEKLDTSRFEIASVASSSITNKQSTTSKVFLNKVQRSKRLSLSKKQTVNELKTPNSTKNTLHRYLSNKSDDSNQIVQTDEKVKSWLKYVTPETSDPVISDSNIDSPLSEKNNDINKTVQKSPFSLLKESNVNNLPRTFPGAKNNSQRKDKEVDEPKFKEVQMRVQEAEMMAKRKKLTSGLSDNTVLKTPGSVPASSHSDSGDWRRVKKVGKEMQIKTFKSLHVSIEKNSTPALSDDDDNESHGSIVQDIKNIPCESETKNIPVIMETVLKGKQEKLSKDNLNKEKDSPKAVIQDYKNYSVDSIDSFKDENISLSCMDEKKVNEIIGIPSNKLNNCEKNKKNVQNSESASSLSKLRMDAEEKGLEPSNQKATVDPISPGKYKLSLKTKLTSTNDSNKSSPKIPGSSVIKLNESPILSSPERPKSRLALKLPSKFNENPIKNANSPVQSCNDQPRSPVKQMCTFVESNDNKLNKNFTKHVNVSVKNSNKNGKPPNSLNGRHLIIFKKLGKMCKKQRNVPFLLLGKMRPKEKKLTVVMKSIEPVHFNLENIKKNSIKMQYKVHSDEVKMLSPEKDSQLKFLAIESPDRQHLFSKSNKCKPHRPAASESTSESMDIDETFYKKDKTPKKQLILANKNIEDKVSNNEILDNENKNSQYVKVNKISKIYKETENVSDAVDISYTKASEENDDVNQMQKQSEEKINKIRDDIYSVSSSESEIPGTGNYNNREKGLNTNTDKCMNLNENSEEENAIDIDTTFYEQKRKNFEKEKSVSSNSSSTPIKKLPMKKKRTHSESSTDDVSSIIDKWCGREEEHVIKKAKVVTRAQIHSSFNEKNQKPDHLDDLSSIDDCDIDIIDDKNDKIEIKRDSPIDDIIHQVKEFKQNDINVNKLSTMPSSLHSADLFETNEQSIQQTTVQKVFQESSKVMHDNLSSPCKNKNKENFNETDLLDITVLDKNQFQTNKSNLSRNSNSSNKENNNLMLNDSLSKSQKDPYNVPDSLMNVTQDQMEIKNIEKALIGIDLSIVQNVKEKENITTPTRKNKQSVISDKTDDEFDTDNIDATPVAKRRTLFSVVTSKHKADVNESIVLPSPEKQLNLIPAVTPMRNRTSYPLCHSTPMSTSPVNDIKTKNISLVCSGFTPENIGIVQNFAKKFNAKFQSSFTMDITHVIVQTDPETKGGQKTFKYIQGIAFQKYVVSFQWVLDCLAENKLLNEDDEKYDVLDPDVLEPGSKKSRKSSKDLFNDYAFFCLEPFISLPLAEFKNLLTFNGAIITATPKELSFKNDKFKIIILESENLSDPQISMLKKSKAILVSFEWIVDSISQYSIIPLTQYLYETSIEEALELGFPAEYLPYDNMDEDFE